MSTQHILNTGILPKNGKPFAVILQSEKNIEDILALQALVLSGLTEAEKCFILPKSRAFFEKHLAAGNPVLGIVSEGQLIAQSIVVNPTKERPSTGMVDMRLKAKPEKVTLIQGIIVHPGYRGNALMSVMVDEWLEIAKKQGRTHAIAEVATDNEYSLAVFLKEGLTIHSTGTDPADGTKVFNIHAKVKPLIRKRLSASFNSKSGKSSPKIQAKKSKGFQP